jgi:hypothetical protein
MLSPDTKIISMSTTLKEINADEFKKWLRKSQHLSGKVPSDISSRAKRVARWVNFDIKKTEAELVDLMEEKSGSNLNPVIYSQLKRAVRLYREFRK